MSFDITGVVHKKYDTESKSASFQAREFVIKTEDTYPQYVKFQLTQDRCPIIEEYNEGDSIKVYFDLRGREWNDKYFTNLNAWRVERPSTQAVPSAPKAAQPQGFDTFDGGGSNVSMEDLDNLPF